MSISRFTIEPLEGQNRKSFSSGVPALDDYLVNRAGQDMRRRIAACFLAVERETTTVAGFYTLSACHVLLDHLPPDLSKGLPRYPAVPAARLERLAVDIRFRSLGLGSALVADAVGRCAGSDIAVNLLAVDAKDEAAARFYERLGFRRFDAQALELIASVAVLSRNPDR